MNYENFWNDVQENTDKRNKKCSSGFRCCWIWFNDLGMPMACLYWLNVLSLAVSEQNNTLRIKISYSGALQSLISITDNYFCHQDVMFWWQQRRLHVFSQFRPRMDILTMPWYLELQMLYLKMKSKRFECLNICNR